MNDAELLKEVNDIFLNGNFGSTEEVVLGLLIIAGALLLVIAAIGLIFLILDVVGKWRMFKKAGDSGWKALIPIYNTYTQCKIIGISPWWLLVIFICYLISSFFIPFKFVGEIVIIYFNIIIALSTARSYGKSDGFGIGLFLLSPVFNMIIGFDNSKYEGQKPIGDLLYTTVETPKPESPKAETKAKNVKKTTTKKTTTKKSKTTEAKKTTTKKKAPAKKTTTKKQTPKKTTTRKTTTKKNTKK